MVAMVEDYEYLLQDHDIHFDAVNSQVMYELLFCVFFTS